MESSASQKARTAESVLTAIQNDLDILSKRLQQAGIYVLENPRDVALQSITALARNAGVQPSVFMRLAKRFGFSGYSDFQNVFRAALANQTYSYGERIMQMQRDYSDPATFPDLMGLIGVFSQMNSEVLAQLASNLDGDAVEAFVTGLKEAEEIFIIGQRRSFTVASYLAYALMRSDIRTRLLAGTGGTLRDEIHLMKEKDILVAISIHPYADDVIEIVDGVKSAGRTVMVLTDSEYSPLAKRADTMIVVRDVLYLGFRSLIAQMCVIQAIAIAIAADPARSGKN